MQATHDYVDFYLIGKNWLHSDKVDAVRGLLLNLRVADLKDYIATLKKDALDTTDHYVATMKLFMFMEVLWSDVTTKGNRHLRGQGTMGPEEETTDDDEDMPPQSKI